MVLPTSPAIWLNGSTATGLGLHISTNFMKLFGGTLEIKSKVDSGTKVTLRFPSERTIQSS
jgi:signal transduction histidine kinase